MECLLILCFFFIIPLSSGADTIYANQSLTGNQTIISNGGNFELGFFKPGNTSNYYIGIWYKKVKTQTIVWVANRETPIFDRFSSKLKLRDGNLVLLNESNTPIWSTNMSSTDMSASSVALLDDGNLVLRYGSSSREPIWQSFDHPSHTFLPGSKLGYNKRTNTANVITSWRNKEDPAAGVFSLEIVQNTKRYALKWNTSVEYWTSGPWNGRFFGGLPDMEVPYIYNFSYTDNENESYFTYWSTNPSVISGMVLDVSGQMQQLTWKETSQQWYLFWSQPKEICDVYAKCGAFSLCNQQISPFCNCLAGFEPTSQSEFSGGCVRKTELNCGVKEEKTGFILSYVPVKYFPTSHDQNETLSLDESMCRRSCLDDCNCEGYSFFFEKCRLWNSEKLNSISIVFVSDDSSVRKFEVNIKVASKDLQHPIQNIHKNDKINLGAVIGSVVAGLVFVSGVVFLIIYKKKRICVGKTRMEGSLVAFAYKDLHVNLVRLRGFCAQGSSKLLVYDYMPNGSLDSHLFHEKEDKFLNWQTRYDIALGIARGLVYLHEKCRDCIIHCDIKPENILLDADFCPKLAYFGLAKLVGRDFSRVLTTFRGTKGYLAPEWLSGVPITAKADVFSYGMMLFELVYGKRNAEQSDESRSKFFPSLVANVLMVGGDILSLVDNKLKREASVEQVTRICKVACWCIQDEEDSRPCMSLVEQILEGVSDINMPPVPRTVKLFLESTEPIVFFTESSSNGNSSSCDSHESKSASS